MIITTRLHFRFKNIHDLRAHFKGLRCEICSQAFCKQSALKAHQDQGCEALIESPEVVECKPVIIDTGLGVNLENDDENGAPIECGIIPKEMQSSDDENMGDFNGNDETDDSNYAEISAENQSMRSEPGHSNAGNSSRTRKPRKRKPSKKQKAALGNQKDEADRIFHCYLCEKK